MSDAGKDPIPDIKKSLNYAKSYKNVKILWASTREAYNFTNAKQLGCHIITAVSYTHLTLPTNREV